MIQSRKHLYKLLKVDKKTLCYLFDNIDEYYYVRKEKKYFADGNPKLNSKGEQKYRILHPSKNPLKKIQKKLKLKKKFEKKTKSNLKIFQMPRLIWERSII